MAFLSEEPGQVAHAGGKKAPGRAKAGQGGADVPTQTPPQGVGGAAGRWAGSWAIRRRECLEGMSVDLLQAAGRALGGFQIPPMPHLPPAEAEEAPGRVCRYTIYELLAL